MKTLRKRLVCVNRGHGVDGAMKSKTAIDKVQGRYVEKMRSKGWLFSDEGAFTCEGNAGGYWERYITIYKLNAKFDKDAEFAKEYNLT